jgi:hypothetical protein
MSCPRCTCPQWIEEDPSGLLLANCRSCGEIIVGDWADIPPLQFEPAEGD